MSTGCDIAGITTRQPIAMRNTAGTRTLTLMGLGMSGLVCRSQSMPTTEAPTESHRV